MMKQFILSRPASAQTEVSGRCEAKARYEVTQWSAHCYKEEVINDERKCQAFQQYCDWVVPYREPMPEVNSTLYTPEDIWGKTEVMESTYSSEFADRAVVQAQDGYFYWVGDDNQPVSNRPSKWVFWHYDVLADPPFHHPKNEAYDNCDCNFGEPQEEDGMYVNSLCGIECSKNYLYNASEANGEYPDILSVVTTIHHKFCHRESDLDGMAWDPSYLWNVMMPLSTIYLDEFGPNGLNLQRGEKGPSWYWYGSSKPSWNHNDQTSHVFYGERKYDTEEDCRLDMLNYWRQVLNNDDYEVFDHCSMISSRCPTVTNRECRDACRGETSVDIFAGGDNLSFLRNKCMYTPYFPENDHAWPNFAVPDQNQCFAQWQVGYEDQACDGNMDPEYDNSVVFDYGWCYRPFGKVGEASCAAAECGKIIMDGPSRPRDVETAQECQQFCQDDPRCVHFQWRPIQDYANSGMGNNFNRVRSCLLKSQAQFEGALRARWGRDGKWIWDPQFEGAKYANIYQNNDCYGSTSGEGFNWCLACRDNEEDEDFAYHALKWRNNMISGPKFCDEPRIEHGNLINRPQSHWFDPEAHGMTGSIKNDIGVCPKYEGVVETVYGADAASHHGAPEGCNIRPEFKDSDIEGADEWTLFCDMSHEGYSTNTPLSSAQSTCRKYYAYCEWIIAFRENQSKFQLSDAVMGIGLGQIEQNTWSSTFDYAPVTIPASNGDVSRNDLRDRDEKWVFWHPSLAEQTYSQTSCDCMNPECDDEACDEIANSADVYKLYLLHDSVCHRESDVAAVRYDPAPVWARNQSYLDATQIWREGLGMVAGEAGAGFLWYTQSKPSWNEFPQTAHDAVFSYYKFDSEPDCRAWAQQYWDSQGFTGSFLSVCKYMSSIVPGVSNAQCHNACENYDQNADSEWFSRNCRYTPYQAESEHPWPNTFVPDSNECFSQYQIGYEDQACDHCISELYDNTTEFEGGWEYGGGCNAQCGKFIMASPGKPLDVQTAHECQQYCQEDKRCVQWQWRASPDYTKADNLYIDGDVETVLDNNHFNKVRLCALKDIDQVMGALDSTWNEQGVYSGPAADEGKFSNGEFAVNDSQFCTQDEEYNCNSWYLYCDGVAHAWKWRNNMISGPRYCSAESARIAHGGSATGFVSGACPTIESFGCNGECEAVEATAYETVPLVLSEEFPTGWANVPTPGDTFTGWAPEIEGAVGDDVCCDFTPSDCGNAWSDSCKNGLTLGCAMTCYINTQWENWTQDMESCVDMHAYFEQQFGAAPIEACAASSEKLIPTTTTTIAPSALC